MKRAKWCLGLLLVGVLLFMGGCSSQSWEGLQEQVDALEARISALEFVPLVPPAEPAESTGYSDINIPISQFQLQPHRDVVMSTVLGGELTVTLGSNPTTGYQWSEEAKIDDVAILWQVAHGFAFPEDMEEEPPPGTPGEEIWIFKGVKRGTTTILLGYSRPWETSRTPDSDVEGVRKASLWTVTITATIR